MVFAHFVSLDRKLYPNGAVMFKPEVLIADLFPVGSNTGFGVCKTPSILPLGVGFTLQVMKRSLLLPTLVQTLLSF